MQRKKVPLKGGWLSQVEDGVPFSLVADTQITPMPKPHRIATRAIRSLGELWTVQEAADYLRVHRDTVYGWIYEKRLKPKRAGRLIRIEVSELERFLSCA